MKNSLTSPLHRHFFHNSPYSHLDTGQQSRHCLIFLLSVILFFLLVVFSPLSSSFFFFQFYPITESNEYRQHGEPIDISFWMRYNAIYELAGVRWFIHVSWLFVVVFCHGFLDLLVQDGTGEREEPELIIEVSLDLQLASEMKWIDEHSMLKIFQVHLKPNLVRIRIWIHLNASIRTWRIPSIPQRWLQRVFSSDTEISNEDDSKMDLAYRPISNDDNEGNALKPTDWNDIGYLLEFCQQQGSYKKISLLLCMTWWHFKMNCRDISKFWQQMRGTSRQTSHPWAKIYVNGDIIELNCDSPGVKFFESFYDVFPRIENEAKLFALKEFQKLSSSLTAVDLRNFYWYEIFRTN